MTLIDSFCALLGCAVVAMGAFGVAGPDAGPRDLPAGRGEGEP